MNPDEIKVQLAELNGRLSAIQQLMEQRVHQLERDLKREVEDAESDHARLYDRLDQQGEFIRELQSWKDRIIGVGLGIAAVSGLLSGSVVAVAPAIARAVGG